jgi:hypothetical protein
LRSDGGSQVVAGKSAPMMNCRIMPTVTSSLAERILLK